MRLVVTGRRRSGTTITRKTLNSHPDIWITNELLLYDFFCGYSKFPSFNKWVKKRFTKNHRQERFAFPFDTDRASFKKAYKKKVKNRKSVADKITAAEECIFRGQYTVFGDKGGYEAVNGLREAGLPFKVLYIYRDGRDSVASSMSRNKDKKDDDSWKTADPYQSSVYWANSVKEWFAVKKRLDKNSYLEIKFEQFMENPEQLFAGMADFLEVADLFDRHVIAKDRANIGRYKSEIPDWEFVFSQEALEILKQLEYVA